MEEKLGQMLLCGVRVYHAILDFFGMFVSNETTYSTSWKICNLDTLEFHCGDTREEFAFTDDYSVILHTVCRNKGLLKDVRTAVHWSDFHRDPYTTATLFESPPAPWLFIGYRDGEDTIDCTEMVNQYICYGNLIDISLLNFIIDETKEKVWVYIDPKTFEENEFPSDGILITKDDDDPEENTGDKKND